MTYEQYIEETIENCKKVLSDCSAGELLDIEHLKKILWEDDRVTGVISGYCTCTTGPATENISGVLFNKEFLADFNANELNMQTMMQRGAEAIDITARCLALSHVNVNELADKEYSRRIEKNCDVRRITSRV